MLFVYISASNNYCSENSSETKAHRGRVISSLELLKVKQKLSQKFNNDPRKDFHKNCFKIRKKISVQKFPTKKPERER